MFQKTSLSIGAERLTTLDLTPRQSFEVRNKFQEHFRGKPVFQATVLQERVVLFAGVQMRYLRPIIC